MKIRLRSALPGSMIFFALVVASAFMALSASATTVCSSVATPLPPGPSVSPGNCTGIGAGTILASVTVPFNSVLGKVSGTFNSAVYEEPGGTLDFLYQVTNNSTCLTPPCANITGVDVFNFLGVSIGVATRTDGGNTSSTTGLGGGDVFSNGSVPPDFAFRLASGTVLNALFIFNSNLIIPGETSDALIVTTNATAFNPSTVDIDDGPSDLAAVVSLEPIAPAVPEPGTLALFGTGLVGIAGLLRRSFLARL